MQVMQERSNSNLKVWLMREPSMCGEVQTQNVESIVLEPLQTHYVVPVSQFRELLQGRWPEGLTGGLGWTFHTTDDSPLISSGGHSSETSTMWG